MNKFPVNPSCFRFYNANPKGKITSDCSVRAICTALDQDYIQTLKELVDITIRDGDFVNSKECITEYLRIKKWVKMPIPRNENGKQITGEEFCRNIAKINKTYIVKLGKRHCACVHHKQIYDTWDSSGELVGNYWVKKDKEVKK